MTEQTADPRRDARPQPDPDLPRPSAGAPADAMPDTTHATTLGATAAEALAPGAAAAPAEAAPAAAPAASNVRPIPARPGARPGAAARRLGPGANPGAGPVVDSNVRPLPAGAPARPRPQAVPPAARPTTRAAHARPRHLGLLASFLLLVALPFATTVYYLWWRAAPEYHSETAFSVRSEEIGAAAAGLLGALTQIGGGSASDINVLYDFIRSPEIVKRVDAKLDLRTMWNRDEGRDPYFSLGDDPSNEVLLEHWRRMVQVTLESSEGILTVKAFAFTPEDAKALTEAVLAESNTLINALSDKARDDALSFARRELAEIEGRLRDARQDMTAFRREHRMIDPSADIATQSGLLNALQGELAHALVERDMLLSYTDATDQRVVQADRRIDAIGKRIEAERDAMQGGTGGGGAGTTDGATDGEDATVAGAEPGVTEGAALPDVLGAYEELKVDLEFANNAYTHALAGLAAAQAQASRQTRYLVPHVQPTLADTALYPRKPLIAGMVGLFLFLGWSVLLLIYYNVRDNR